MGLFSFIQTMLVRSALKLAMRHEVPAMIPMSGSEVKQRNYSVALLVDLEGPSSLWVEKVLPDGVEGKWFDTKDAKPEAKKISNAQLDQFRLEITQYLRELEIQYTSAVEYIDHVTLGVPWLRIARERLTQHLYDRRKKVRADRITILRLILECTFEDRTFSTSPERLMTLLYGPRWGRSKGTAKLYFYYETLLDSLTVDQELVKENHAYRLAPSAINTLERYDREDRRSSSDTKIQRGIAWLTGVLALIALLQLWQAYWSEMHPDPAPQRTQGPTVSH